MSRANRDDRQTSLARKRGASRRTTHWRGRSTKHPDEGLYFHRREDERARIAPTFGVIPARTVKSFSCASCHLDWESCPKCGIGVLVEVLQQADLLWRKVAETHLHCVGGCGLTQ